MVYERHCATFAPRGVSGPHYRITLSNRDFAASLQARGVGAGVEVMVEVTLIDRWTTHRLATRQSQSKRAGYPSLMIA